jgi:hypothetical protein
VHAANKLAGKHQRVSILQKDPTLCDVCKEKSAFFFCTSDRALLCRDCDVGIHAGNEFAASHTRLLVTGAAVALEALPSNHTEAAPPSTEARELGGVREVQAPPPPPSPQQQQHRTPNQFGDDGIVTHEDTRSDSMPAMLAVNSNWMSVPAPQTPTHLSSLNSRSNQMTSFDRAPRTISPNNNAVRNDTSGVVGNRLRNNNVVGVAGIGCGGNGLVPNNNGGSQLERLNSIPGFLPEPFGVEDLLGLPHIQAGYGLGDVASSKGDEGQYDWQPDFSIMDEYMMLEDNFHQVPSMTFSAPGVMTGRVGRGAAAGKGKGKQDSIVPDYDDSFVVPDLGYIHSAPASPPLGKRQRR